MEPIRLTDRQGRAFWKRLDTDSECWLWCGPLSRDGYGRVSFKKKTYQVHRVMYELFFQQPLTPDVCVLHRCDVPRCARPSHLFLGTRADNNRDCADKGRTCRGESSPSSRLTEEQVKAILRSAEPAIALAERYPVSNVTIGKIRRGRAWTHVTGLTPK